MIHFEKRRRVPVVAPLPVALAVLWLAGLCILWNLDGASAKACLLYDSVGLACPACGSSRAGFSLLRGDIPTAFIHNPLVSLVLCAGACILAIRFITARQLTINWSLPISQIIPLFLVVAVLANWIYVISRN